MVTVPKTEETMLKCICNSCPSYTECMQTGKVGLFCSSGDEIRCFESSEGCNCSECSVSADFDFSSIYHCKDGSADMQSR